MTEQHPVPPQLDPLSTPSLTDMPSVPVDPAVTSVPVDPAAVDPPEVDAPAVRPYELPSGHFGFLVYNLLRVGLLLVVGGIAYLFGFRSYLLVLVAVFISGMISMVLLNRRRDAAVISLGEVFRRVNDRMDSRTRAEDE